MNPKLSHGHRSDILVLVFIVGRHITSTSLGLIQGMSRKDCNRPCLFKRTVACLRSSACMLLLEYGLARPPKHQRDPTKRHITLDGPTRGCSKRAKRRNMGNCWGIHNPKGFCRVAIPSLPRLQGSRGHRQPGGFAEQKSHCLASDC